MSLSYSQEKADIGHRRVALRRRLSHLMTPPPYSTDEKREAWLHGYNQALDDIAARPDVRDELR